MSENLYSDVYDDDYTEPAAPAESGPKALREAYEKEKEARKQLEDRLNKLEQAEQQKSLASALEGKGVNPKAAKLALSQGVTPDKLDEWLGEWGDLFGAQAQQAEPGTTVDPETQQQIAAVSGAPSGAPSSGNQADAVAQISGIDNEADFWATIKAAKG